MISSEFDLFSQIIEIALLYFYKKQKAKPLPLFSPTNTHNFVQRPSDDRYLFSRTIFTSITATDMSGSLMIDIAAQIAVPFAPRHTDFFRHDGLYRDVRIVHTFFVQWVIIFGKETVPVGNLVDVLLHAGRHETFGLNEIFFGPFTFVQTWREREKSSYKYSDISIPTEDVLTMVVLTYQDEPDFLAKEHHPKQPPALKFLSTSF